MSEFKHPYLITIPAQTVFHVSLNSNVYEKSFDACNETPVQLTAILPQLSVFMHSIASGNGEFYQQVEEKEEELPPQSAHPIQQKHDRIKILESAEGASIVSFSQLSIETALEIICNPVRQQYADLLENTLLFAFQIQLKSIKPHQCDCDQELCLCQISSTPALQLLQKTSQLLIPDPTQSFNDRLNTKLSFRQYRDSTISFLKRWLVLRYPEDCSLDVLDILLKIFRRVCQFENLHVEFTYQQQDQQIQFNYVSENSQLADQEQQTIQALSNFENLIQEINRIIIQIEIEQKKFQQSKVNYMTQPQSSALSLMLFQPQQLCTESLCVDRQKINKILNSKQFLKYYSRIDFKLQFQLNKQASNEQIQQQNQTFLQLFKNLLLEHPIEFAQVITVYFAEVYLAITPRDIQQYAVNKPSFNLQQEFQRFNAMNTLIALIIINIQFNQIDMAQKQCNNKLSQSEYMTMTEKFNISLKEREEVLKKLAHICQLLFELRNMEGIFCVIGAIECQQRLYTEELFKQVLSALQADQSNTWLVEAGKYNVDQGLNMGSKLAVQFYNHEEIYLFNQYVPFFKNGQLIFKQHDFIKENQYYSIDQLEELVRLQLDDAIPVDLKQLNEKLGKAADVYSIQQKTGNFKFYRQVMKQCTNQRQMIIPHFGIINKDYIGINEAMSNYSDENKQFINFSKSTVMYEQCLQFLAPQLSFLGLQFDDVDVFLSQNVTAQKMRQKNSATVDLLNWLRQFSNQFNQNSYDLLSLSQFVKPPKPEAQ